MAQVIRSPKTYDVCIIGSGAGGGMAAKILTEGGLNCVLLEAGPNVNPEKDFKMLMWPYELAASRRGRRRPRQPTISANSSRPMAPGKLKASRTPPPPAPISSGFARASSAAAPITGAASPCALLPSISNPARATASATIGPSPTKISRRTTTKSKATSASSAPRKMSPAPPTASFFLRPSRAAPS